MRIKMKEAQEQYGSEHSRIYKIMNSQVENKINLKKDHMKLHIPRYFTVKLQITKNKKKVHVPREKSRFTTEN